MPKSFAVRQKNLLWKILRNVSLQLLSLDWKQIHPNDLLIKAKVPNQTKPKVILPCADATTAQSVLTSRQTR